VKFLLTILSVLAISACTSTPATPGAPAPAGVGCSVEQVVSGALAASIGTGLQCANLTAIQADLQGALGTANLCATSVAQAQSKVEGKQPMKGVVGDLVCPLAVNTAMGLINTKIPAAWGCKVTSGSNIGSVLSAACIAVVPI